MIFWWNLKITSFRFVFPCLPPLMPIFLIVIFQNVSIVQDLNKGILISDRSLVLQKVKRTQAGNYTCIASNLEGDAASNPLNVQIMCKLHLWFSTHLDFQPNFQMHQYAIMKMLCLSVLILDQTCLHCVVSTHFRTPVALAGPSTTARRLTMCQGRHLQWIGRQV